MHRVRHCWLIITGRIDFDYSPERMEFHMALDKFNAAAAELADAANRLITKAANDAGAATQAQSDLAAADDAATAAIQPTIDALNAAAPPA